jgi:hypothetical protein
MPVLAKGEGHETWRKNNLGVLKVGCVPEIKSIVWLVVERQLSSNGVTRALRYVYIQIRSACVDDSPCLEGGIVLCKESGLASEVPR